MSRCDTVIGTIKDLENAVTTSRIDCPGRAGGQHNIDNLDTSATDLTYKPNPRSLSRNNPGPEGWLFPHKKGIGVGSNLEAFKSDIKARTERGENCKTIADALNTMGVQTSDRAISRVRIKWGMRKRVTIFPSSSFSSPYLVGRVPQQRINLLANVLAQAQRKRMTPPSESATVRSSARSKVQALRKAEITRMTREGRSAHEICHSLTSRGMELKKGVTTVLRLQSAWNIGAHDEKRWVENFRHQCHKKAKTQQVQAFLAIAAELGVTHTDSWLAGKMAGLVAREARQQLALRLMGRHAPTNPERRKLQSPRKTLDSINHQVEPSSLDDDAEQEESGSDVSPSLYDTSDEDYDALDSTIENNDKDMADSPDVTLDGCLDIDGNGTDEQKTTANAAGDGTLARTDKTIPRATSPGIIPVEVGVVSSHAEEVAEISQRPSQSVSQNRVPICSSATTVLVLGPEEIEANKATLLILDQYNTAAQAYKILLESRNDNRPLPDSLTGLPPSVKEVEAAKQKLKEATHAMMLTLEG